MFNIMHTLSFFIVTTIAIILNFEKCKGETNLVKLDVLRGTEIDIKLEGNPSTGFMWYIISLTKEMPENVTLSYAMLEEISKEDKKKQMVTGEVTDIIVSPLHTEIKEGIVDHLIGSGSTFDNKITVYTPGTYYVKYVYVKASRPPEATFQIVFEINVESTSGPEKENKLQAEKENKSAAEKENKSGEEKENKSAAEKENKSAAEKENKSGEEKENKSGEEKENKSTAEKENKSTGEKENKSGEEKEDKSAAEKEDKSAAEKEDKSAAEKEDKSAAEKEDKSAAEKENKSAAEKQSDSAEEGNNSGGEKESIPAAEIEDISGTQEENGLLHLDVIIETKMCTVGKSVHVTMEGNPSLGNLWYVYDVVGNAAELKTLYQRIPSLMQEKEVNILVTDPSCENISLPSPMVGGSCTFGSVITPKKTGVYYVVYYYRHYSSLFVQKYKFVKVIVF